MPRDGTWLKRYCSGEFDQVWREIRACATIDGELREQVMEVADATMQRVAHNADVIAARLQSVGWQAQKYQGLRTPPNPGDEAVFARIAEISGAPIPPTLLAFWRRVGGINWVWDYDSGDQPAVPDFSLPPEELDALCVHAPSVITYLLDEWIDQGHTERPFCIDLAPDYLHKANISGGNPYCIEVPYLGPDPLFADERHELPFLDYLRLAFRWAGFPGLERHSALVGVRSFVASFTKDLLPF
jgi:hypothetical protein